MCAQGAFGEKLKGVLQVDATSTASDLASVDAHLDMLRPAIASYGASVQVSPSCAIICLSDFCFGASNKLPF